MKGKETVSSVQMAGLLLAFLTGSSIVNIPAPLTGAAKNGAWISVLISCSFGMLVLASILYLSRRYPGMTFIEYSRKTVGNIMTILLAIPFAAALFWMNAAIVIDIGGFFGSTMMRETPLSLIHFLFFLLAALTARAGIEVMARMFAVLLIIMFGFIVLVWVLVSNYYHVEYLLPVIPDGIKPILHGAYISYGFPYSEIALFAMLLSYVRMEDRHKLGKDLLEAVLLNGLTLLLSVVFSVMALGPLASDLKFTLFQMARLIAIQDIFERVESVVGFALIVASYMKVTITLFILSKVLTQLLKVKDDRILILPVSLTCFLLSTTMYANETEFLQDVNVVWPLLNNTSFFLPIMILVLATVMKRMIK